MSEPPAGLAPATWPGGIAAITLFVEDLAEAKRFYDEVKRRGAERLNGPVARP